ncbi:MAG: 3-phosphoshikimate 1-carboxyvinyltransferase [Spirochaetes bacterium]|nr:3-phosphoshikimate 1-carboxyvinyltransferase [Spirochaetota bacterium]
MIRSCEKHEIRGGIDAPPSKSSQQRAIACAALAQGESRIQGIQFCEDSQIALGLAEALGARVKADGRAIIVSGSPRFSGGQSDKSTSAVLAGTKSELEFDCGESGLCMRMFSPIAALLDIPVHMRGRGSLAARPMNMVAEPLKAMGVSVETNGDRSPLRIRGPLRGGGYAMDAGESSQFLTGLLIALPLAVGDSVLRVERLVSRGYIDLTIETCEAFGVSILMDNNYSRFIIEGGQRYSPVDFTPEGDWSGAAFLVAAAAIAAGEGGLAIRGLRDDSSQPDKAVIDAVMSAGVPLSWVGTSLIVGRGSLSPFEFDATDCPDLFPPLAALAAACPGRSILHGTWRLASKESDRAKSLASCLSRMGASVELQGDKMLIGGGRLHGAAIDASGDHRIAMAAAVAALDASDPVHIAGAECVAKSWPAFFEDLASISGDPGSGVPQERTT